MIPACVPDVMTDLRILSLEIQRMPKIYGQTFADPADYDTLEQDHQLELTDIYAGMDSGSIFMKDKTTGKEIKLCCDFTDRQKAILKAGSLLKYTAKGE